MCSENEIISNSNNKPFKILYFIKLGTYIVLLSDDKGNLRLKC